MNKCRCDLGQWHEHEISFMKTRVRDGQKRRVGLFISAEKQVEVDGSRLFHRFVAAAQQVFDSQQPSHHLRRRDAFRPDLDGHVQKRQVAVDIDRLGLVNCGQFCYGKAGLHKGAHRKQKIPGPVAQIRSDPDISCY